ncbi:MAG TPA: hypothetical protein VI548_14025 [Chitinophagaceae bacterium]|nr:hypothetical protein [Chitinophagaceae bacterium]
MEVHAHSHTPRRKWTHYFWEFLMLFLAVFCGFLAEYQLEHKIERDREKEYIISMIEDLAADTSNLSDGIKQFETLELQIDTVLEMYQKLATGYNDKLHRNLNASLGFPDFIYTDRTMQQLKNSGNMRLIRKKVAADGIMDYDSKVRDIIGIDQPALNVVFEKMLRFWNELIDVEAIETDKTLLSVAKMENGSRNYLLKADKASLGNFNNTIREFKLVAFTILEPKQKVLKEKAIQLITLLKKEYHLK